ncbi:NAD-dependent epimerase/dehydratase family protein [candidate division KSB1 bacterium]|nr:NAD-dependent epimerase/dehydratase family protein [candidate division KSB1 bacterium]
MAKTALVTGASGFTGGYMVKNLLDHGYQVRAFVRKTSNTAELKKLPVELAYGDICSFADVEPALKGVDIVFHIAALYRAANLPDKTYFDVNVNGTENILRAALEHNVKRVVYCSTVGVHGHVENPPANETAPFHPGDIYQVTKVEAEKLVMEYYRLKKLPVTIVRPSGIYGPGDLRMLKMYRMVEKKRFLMLGRNDPFYHLTFVTDIVEGFRLAGENPDAAGQAYIIAGDGYGTLKQFAKTIADDLGIKFYVIKLPLWPVYYLGFLCEKICVPLRIQPPIFRRRVDIYLKDRAFDISKAKKELDFQPLVDIREGIHRTADWYIKEGYLKPRN